jgi:hypothetical protein
MSLSDDIDALNALIEQQLADGEPETGFDYGDPDYPKCPNPYCHESWHGLAITARMREMRELWGEVDPDYRYDQDDSPVICPGSNFDGDWEQYKPKPVSYTSADLDRFSAFARRPVYALNPESAGGIVRGPDHPDAPDSDDVVRRVVLQGGNYMIIGPSRPQEFANAVDAADDRVRQGVREVIEMLSQLDIEEWQRNLMRSLIEQLQRDPGPSVSLSRGEHVLSASDVQAAGDLTRQQAERLHDAHQRLQSRRWLLDRWEQANPGPGGYAVPANYDSLVGPAQPSAEELRQNYRDLGYAPLERLGDDYHETYVSDAAALEAGDGE